MADIRDASGEQPSDLDPGGAARVVLANRAASTPASPQVEAVEVIPVLEETLAVATLRRLTGVVRVSTHTEAVQEIAEAELDRYRVEVTRVPVGRVVDGAPSARAEGDVTIIPVVEERLVTMKQLVLVEELHVRHVLERVTVTEPVTLRRQRAVVERFDAAGQGVSEDDRNAS
ncbi:DUF2382 domain-containing protein [Lichenibacterium minor]|uniref:DUF2382 domain-containing protein n=1 Tax=Lichenibacterium minor TaxID=2316528 RepID=A0A4Q2U3K0_9HYPH|nr:YsnF/AvaK domain-containing protein [Lichenibacterium minor]RYC29326.1 DUF2382 domain-containing protein [Lichenibacterium minor]